MIVGVICGKEENLSKIATKINAPPKTIYGIFTDSILASVLEAVAEPKIAKATINGPIVVPRLLIPPAIVKRCDPVSVGPTSIASGFATICCKENPNPNINNPVIINGNEPKFAAG